MTLNKLLLAAGFTVCTFFANAAVKPASDNQLSSVECTQINEDHLHITCKLSNSAGEQSELASSLINYDVKNSTGKVIATGFGNTVYVDVSKLESQEEYNIIVYALVNGSIVSQTVSKRAPAK